MGSFDYDLGLDPDRLPRLSHLGADLGRASTLAPQARKNLAQIPLFVCAFGAQDIALRQAEPDVHCFEYFLGEDEAQAECYS